MAVFWPVNAVLLAVLVRCPQWATRAGWGMAVLGYLAADLLTGSSLQKALLLNAANLTGVVVGYLLFMRLSPPARMLQRGASSMYLFGICLAAAAATGVVGAGVSQWLFGRPYLTSLALWFSSEFTNYVTLMPFILVFPADWRYRLRVACAMLTQRSQWPQAGRKNGGVGAAGAGGGLQRADRRPRRGDLPMPVLLWLAMSFSLFSTMIAVLVYVLWCHLAIDFGLLEHHARHEGAAEHGIDAFGHRAAGAGADCRRQHELCAQRAVAHAGARGESRCVDPRADAQCVYAARRASDRPERRAGVRHDARHRLLQIDQ